MRRIPETSEKLESPTAFEDVVAAAHFGPLCGPWTALAKCHLEDARTFMVILHNRSGDPARLSYSF